MQYYNNISNAEYLRAAHEMNISENSKDQKIREAALAEAETEYRENSKTYMDFMQEAADIQHKAGKFFANVKNTLLSECIYKIYKDSFFGPMDEQMRNISKNLVNRFVLENGAQNLLNNFRTKNLLLSEVNRIVTKYYNAIVQECDKGDYKGSEFVVPDSTKDDFLAEIEELDTDEACKLIKDRVGDSITEFMDSNTLAKLEYEEMLTNAQDHINNMKETDPNAEIKAQEAASLVQREIQERELRRDKNVFHCIVQKLAESAIKDDKLKEIYTEGGTIDMDKVVNHAHLFLNLLEMANTTEMITINEEYLNNYIKSLEL